MIDQSPMDADVLATLLEYQEIEDDQELIERLATHLTQARQEIIELESILKRADGFVDLCRHIGRRDFWLTDAGYEMLVNEEDRLIQSRVLEYDALRGRVENDGNEGT